APAAEGSAAWTLPPQSHRRHRFRETVAREDGARCRRAQRRLLRHGWRLGLRIGPLRRLPRLRGARTATEGSGSAATHVRRGGRSYIHAPLMSSPNRPEVVVVTGASGGVGRAIAHAFAKRGANIGLVARGEHGLLGAKEEVASFGGKALVLPTDIADHEQVEAAAEAVEREFGPIDMWVNDAMATVFAHFL